MHFSEREWQEPEPEPSHETHCGLCGGPHHTTPESLDACLVMNAKCSTYIMTGVWPKDEAAGVQPTGVDEIVCHDEEPV